MDTKVSYKGVTGTTIIKDNDTWICGAVRSFLMGYMYHAKRVHFSCHIEEGDVSNLESMVQLGMSKPDACTIQSV